MTAKNDGRAAVFCPRRVQNSMTVKMISAMLIMTLMELTGPEN